MDLENVIRAIRDQLSDAGISPDAATPAIVDAGPVKVVCISGHLGDSLEAMNARPRDQVVMVRVGGEIVEDLDAWVETGAVKSRSEAAALFIQEGLRLRSAELDRLRTAIGGVREAKERLREEATRVLGGRADEEIEDE